MENTSIKVNLSELINVEAVDFGKVFYLPPKLPDMSLIVFKKEGYYQAICIDIEIDAVGKDLKEACENLRKKLGSYIKQMVANYDGNEKAAMNDIVRIAFSEGMLKTMLFNRYLMAKHQYILDRIAKESKVKSSREEIVILLKMIFQMLFQLNRPQIRFNLRLAAGVA
jgi:hypothetical protein